MSAADLLGRLAQLLERCGIPYMVVGSFASAFHGQLRTTQDIDVVIDPTPPALKALLSRLPEAEYYVSQEAAEDALRRRGMYIDRWAPRLGVSDAWQRIRRKP